LVNIKLKKVNKIFGSDVHVLKDVDLEIKDKEFMVLVGPSGCGKSTCLNIIAGLEIGLTELYIILYLLSMGGILIFSILLHTKKNNNLEKFTLYTLIALLSFVSLMTYTDILLLYNITISLFQVLLFLGIFFYHQKDERYKWFIKPCVILFINVHINNNSYHIGIYFII